MHIDPVEIYADASDAAVMRHPGRRFPGVLIQGDTLSGLCATAERNLREWSAAFDADTYVELTICEIASGAFCCTKSCWGEHNISLPFSDRPPPVTYEP